MCRGFLLAFHGKGPLRWSLRTTSRVQGGHTLCKQVRQTVLMLCCLMKLVYAEGKGVEWCQPAPLSPEVGREQIASALREPLLEE